MASALSEPICLVVSVEILPDRIDAFLAAMEIDAVGSRLEEGCLRFDVLRDEADPNKFIFYEVYVSDDAVAFHRAQPHFQAWADFKAAGGVVSQAVVKAKGTYYTF